ncbi:NUDIX hydrolase domain-like protein [Lyophyllum atratum]|nr:NUDIX hydrolase domain-like protein [Lyophyllum atratum]
MFSGSPLNRLSWLRTSHPFLNAIIVSPATRWLVFNSGQPLVLINSGSPINQSLTFLTTKDVRPFLGPEPFFGQGKDEGELVIEYPEVEHSPTEAVRHRGIPIVCRREHRRTPYFSMDIADLELTTVQLKEILDATSAAQNGEVLSWSEPRTLMTGLDTRSLVDWNLRNKFCAGCGSPVYSMWGGWKLSCSSLLPWVDKTVYTILPILVHDPVVIMIAIDETGDKIFLGRGKKFPGKFYSALAGFIEPGETFEDAVIREMWEEAGVTAWDIKYHSAQPWPYPANLMVGFYARADSAEKIRLDLDNELADARWFTRDEIRAVLGHPIGGKFGSAEYKKMAESTEGRNNQQGIPHWNPFHEDKPKLD